MKKRIALALLGALLVMASVPTVAYAQEESTESTENTNTLTPDKKPATTITKQINEDVYQVLDFDDTQEEEFAKKGFITAPDSLQITDDDGNVVWNMDNYDFVRDADSPDSANPSLWRNTKSNANYGLFQVSDDIYQVRGYDLSNMTFVRTDNGWIIMDCLASSDTAKAALELFKYEMGDIHIVAVIISHAHVDHYGGIQGVLTQDELADSSLSLDEQIASGKTAIIVPDGFENAVMSENVFAGTAMKRRSLYQYGSVIQPGEQGHLSVGIGLAVSQGEVGYLSPTFNVTEEVFETTIDGVKVIFQLTPDTESPAEMNTYFPDKKALWLAENCTASMHNIYTLRGAEVRDANSWARYITEAQSLFGKDSEVVFQSHNWPHWGNDVIQEYMTNTAAVYKFMHDQTLLYINQGYTSTEIANMIELPEALNKVWYTRQYYGTLKHNVKAIYQKYMGWYDANPVHLDELEPTEYAKKLVEYLGDADKVLEMAKSDYEKGEYQWVAQITNTLVYADSENEQAKYLCADALEQLGYQAESGAWRNAYLVAASELRNGTDMYPPSAVTGSGSTAQQMDMQTTLDYMGIMLDSTKLADKSFTINLQVANDQNYLLKVHHGVLLYYPDEQDENADITITTKKAGVLAIAACNEDGISKLVESVEGDQELYKAFCESMTPLSLYFNIIEP